jgi:flagellar L-ring protein precursor FlgH
MKLIVVIACCAVVYARDSKKENDLERYIREAESTATTPASSSPGSLYSASAPFTGLGLDLRASRLNDLVTVIVQERASAASRGSVSSTRSSNAKSSVSELLGQIPPTKPLGSLARLGTETELNGEGATTRETVLSTSITARVAHVLPNGNLVIEGVKNVTINAETQNVLVRGIIRPVDISGVNTVLSDRIASMEVRVNGKGVVQDAIRRPFFLYRLLLGILPF